MDTDQSTTSSGDKQSNVTREQLKPTAILEPITKSISVQVPWYKRLFVSGLRTETIWRLSFVVILVVGFFIGRAMQRPQTIAIRAGNNNARVSLVPLQTHLPPDAFVQLWATTDSTLTMGQFDVRFDPKKVTIVDAKAPATSVLAGRITITPPLQANTNGKLMIVFSQDLKSVVSAPNGTFQLANITFRIKSKTPNDSTEVNLISQNTKLFHEATPFVISAISNTALLLNSK